MIRGENDRQYFDNKTNDVGRKLLEEWDIVYYFLDLV